MNLSDGVLTWDEGTEEGRHVFALVARAEKAEAERDAATNKLYAIVNTAGADCIRQYVGTEVADEIIAAERQRIDHYRAEVARLRAALTAIQWGSCDGCGTMDRCPLCRERRERDTADGGAPYVEPNEHQPDCIVGLALKGNAS